MENMDTARGAPDVPNGQKENLMNCWEKNKCSQANIETTKLSEIMENKSSTISGMCFHLVLTGQGILAF